MQTHSLGTFPFPARAIVFLFFLHCSEVSLVFAQRYLTTFGRVGELKTGRHSVDMILGDFDGDGGEDLATYGGNQVLVHYQQPDSDGWRSNSLYVGRPVVGATAARCNRDRLTDLILVLSDPPQLQTYLARAGDRFVHVWTHPLPEPIDRFIAADLTNDGRADLLLFGKKRLGIDILVGRGDGSFIPRPTLFPEYSFSEVIVSDVNDDGIQDLIGLQWISNQILVFSSFGKLKFGDPSIIQCTYEPSLIATALLDPDASKDLVITFRDSPTAETYFSDGLGGYHIHQTLRLPSIAGFLQVADVNGDGSDDIGFVSTPTQSLLIGLNNGKGNIDEVIPFSAGKSPTRFLFYPDRQSGATHGALLNTGPSVVRILHSANASTALSAATVYAVGQLPTSVSTSDLNGDGLQDVIVANGGSKSLSVLLNQGIDGFTGQISLSLAGNPEDVRIFPDTDSTFKLVVTNPGSHALSILELDPRRFSRSMVVIPSHGDLQVLWAGRDLLRDGLRIIALELYERSGEYRLLIYDQIGPTRFVEKTITPPEGEILLSATVCDYNADGYQDLIYAVYDRQNARVEVYQAQGTAEGEFQNPRFAFALDQSETVRRVFIWPVDLKVDGIPDLLIYVGEPQNRLLVSSGQCDTTYAPPRLQSNGPVHIASRNRVFFSDMNNDGNTDVVLEDALRRSLRVFLSPGDGTLIRSARLLSTERVGGFSLADLDNDGYPEIIVTRYNEGTLQIISLSE